MASSESTPDLHVTSCEGVAFVLRDDLAAAVGTPTHPFRPDTLQHQVPFKMNTREDVEGSVWMAVPSALKLLHWHAKDAPGEHMPRIGAVRRALLPKPPSGKRAVARKHRWMIAYRQHYVCAKCNLLLHPLGFDIDHVKELRDGGKDVLDNLQALCATCHAKKTRGRGESTFMSDASAGT